MSQGYAALSGLQLYHYHDMSRVIHFCRVRASRKEAHHCLAHCKGKLLAWVCEALTQARKLRHAPGLLVLLLLLLILLRLVLLLLHVSWHCTAPCTCPGVVACVLLRLLHPRQHCTAHRLHPACRQTSIIDRQDWVVSACISACREGVSCLLFMPL